MVSSNHQFGHIASLVITLYQNPTLSAKGLLGQFLHTPLTSTHSFPRPLELQPNWPAFSLWHVLSVPRAQCTLLPLPQCAHSPVATSPGRCLLLIFKIQTLKLGLRHFVNFLFTSPTTGPSNSAQSSFSLYIFMTHLPHYITAPGEQDDTHYWCKENSTHPRKELYFFFFQSQSTLTKFKIQHSQIKSKSSKTK